MVVPKGSVPCRQGKMIVKTVDIDTYGRPQEMMFKSWTPHTKCFVKFTVLMTDHLLTKVTKIAYLTFRFIVAFSHLSTSMSSQSTCRRLFWKQLLHQPIVTHTDVFQRQNSSIFNGENESDTCFYCIFLFVCCVYFILYLYFWLYFIVFFLTFSFNRK